MEPVVNNVEVDVMDVVMAYSEMGYDDLSVEGLPSYEEVLAMIEAHDTAYQAYIDEMVDEWLAAQVSLDDLNFPAFSFEEEMLPF